MTSSIVGTRLSSMLAAGAVTSADEATLGTVTAVLDALVGQPPDDVADERTPLTFRFGVRHDLGEAWWWAAMPAAEGLTGVEALLSGADPTGVDVARQTATQGGADTVGGWSHLGVDGVDAGWFVRGDSLDPEIAAAPPAALLHSVRDHAPRITSVGRSIGAGDVELAWEEPGSADRLGSLCAALGLGELSDGMRRLLPTEPWTARTTVWLSPTGVSRLAVAHLHPAVERRVQTAVQVGADLDRLAYVEAALDATRPAAIEIEIGASGLALVYWYDLYDVGPGPIADHR